MLKKAIYIFIAFLILNGTFIPFFRIQKISEEQIHEPTLFFDDFKSYGNETKHVNLEIIAPLDSFTFSGPFDILFRITNLDDKKIMFSKGDSNNRIDLEANFDSWGVVLWSTSYEGLILSPGEDISKTIKCEVGVYEGSITIRLVHWVKGASGYSVGPMGKSEISGTIVPPSRTGAPIIGFYGPNALSGLATYLQDLGFLVKYVNRSSFTSANVVYLDYRCSPLEEDLLSFVKGGGNLWISGEACGGNFLGAVISNESVEFDVGDNMSRIWMKKHPLTVGISSICYPAGAWIEISGNIEEIIRIDGKPILAIDESRGGKILWLIDSDMFGKYYFDQADNKILAKNIVCWLTGKVERVEELAPYVPTSGQVCTLGTIIIPRGGMSNQVSVKYLHDTDPAHGWNIDLRFNDTNWLNGKIPIGSFWFVRTELPFNDLYIRKKFSIDRIPRNAILSISSSDGTDIWINGMRALSDLNSSHDAFYWNYRINATNFLRIKENLLAIHVKNIHGACFLDFELVFQDKNFKEIILDFVKGRMNEDGGFCDSYIDDTFYATSILKTLDSINMLNRDKVAFWILPHKHTYGCFGNRVEWQYPTIKVLENLGFRLDDESAERLITVLIGWRAEDGSWNRNLWNTWHAIEALASLNALNRIKDWSKTVNFIKSLQGGDGGFSNHPHEITSLTYTFYAIRSLQILNLVDSIDKDKVVGFIMSCYKDGGFSDRPEYEEWIGSTYYGIKSLEILNSLNKVNSETVSNRILSWLGDKGSTGYLYGDYYAVMTLKILNKLNKLDKAKLINNIMKFQNPIDGGFRHESQIYDTEHVISILSNIRMLDKIDKEKIKQWILSYPFYYLSTKEIHSAIYSLKALNALQKVDTEKVINELLKHQLSDGGFGAYEYWNESNLLETYLAIDTLNMLNKLSAIDKGRVINYVLFLKNPDGSFKYGKSVGSYDETTPLAIIILSLLGEAHRIDEKTINWIINNQEEDGGFGNILSTYFSLKALQYLGRLNNTFLTKAVNYVLFLQNLDGGFGWWKGDVWSLLDSTDYATGVLKILYDMGSCYVTVFTLYGIPKGEGWYIKSSTVTLSISPIQIEHENGTRHVFSGWYKDDELLSVNPTYSLIVEKHVTIVADWDTEYEVKVFSEKGTSIGSGWYKREKTATISISPIQIDNDFFSYYIFNCWKVDGTIVSTSPTYSFIVNKPISLVASWRTELKIINIILLVTGSIISIVTLAVLVSSQKRRIPSSSLQSEVEMEIKKYEEYLKRLEELRKEGKISEKVYERLKQEYENKLEELIDKLKK